MCGRLWVPSLLPRLPLATDSHAWVWPFLCAAPLTSPAMPYPTPQQGTPILEPAQHHPCYSPPTPTAAV